MNLAISNTVLPASVRVRVVSIIDAAVGTKIFELASLGAPLPTATAGSHIDVHLPGIVRQYSLVIGSSISPNYTIAVKKERMSSGGSRFLHTDVSIGQELAVSHPRNHFSLDESAAHSVLIAGGIGITPIWSMLNKLTADGRSCELYYAGRSREEMPFADDLSRRPNAYLHIDRDQPGLLDISAILQKAPPGSHFYCCGPVPMLKSFESVMQGIPEERAHREYFASSTPAASDGAFTVELARSGKKLYVQPGQRIIDVLTNAGIHVLMSCEKGICGTCETRVISGVPDHRDDILSESERAEGKTMMVCCSGSISSTLVLDL